MMSHDRVFIRWPLRDRLPAWGFVFIPTGDGACAFGQEIACIATTSR